mmetsp:Transcript_69725/g.176930  ORF Transcript_69725/g.176930 Transcript_69725/m.176930 type:complete len:306 (+) Transcript_69725:303-1220(+)
MHRGFGERNHLRRQAVARAGCPQQRHLFWWRSAQQECAAEGREGCWAPRRARGFGQDLGGGRTLRGHGADAGRGQACGVLRLRWREALQDEGGDASALPVAHGGSAQGRCSGRRCACPGVPEGQGVCRGSRVQGRGAQGCHGLGLRQAADEWRRLRVLRHDPGGRELPRGPGADQVHRWRPERPEVGQRPDSRRGHDDFRRPLLGRDELPLARLGWRLGAACEAADRRLCPAGCGSGLARGRRRLRQDPYEVPQPLQGGGPERDVGVLLQRHGQDHSRLRQDEEDVVLRRFADRRDSGFQGRADN